MSLKEHFYSVLIVSSSEAVSTAMKELLPDSKYSLVQTVTSISAAKREFAERAYDFVIVNAPLPDELGTRFAIDASNSPSTVVLLLVRGDIHAEVYDKVAEHGVFTLQKPTAKPTMLTALGWLASARERLRKFEKKTLSIEEKMEEIRAVNHAKWMLIEQLKMTEPDAHRYIEKRAMDECVSKREIAEEIIKMYS